jgi:hypothetical protein
VRGSARGYYSFGQRESASDIFMSDQEGYGSGRANKFLRECRNENAWRQKYRMHPIRMREPMRVMEKTWVLIPLVQSSNRKEYKEFLKDSPNFIFN